jgi:hypothetical protein
MEELNNSGIQGGESQPTLTEAQGQLESNQADSSVSADSWINDLWETPVVDKSNQPKDQQALPKNQDGHKGADKNQQLESDPNKSNQPKPVSDPNKIFSEASPKAFFDDKGELNNSKINDFIFSDGKSLLNFGSQTPLEIAEDPKAERVDPDAEYSKAISTLMESLPGEVARLRGEGATDSDILERIVAYHENANGKRTQAKEMQSMIEQQKKAFQSEFSEIRETKIQARIDKNNSELAAKVEGFVPGLNGMQTLTQFLLNNNAGGPLLDKLFLQAHPEARTMPPEKRGEVIKPWFRQFQQDKEMLAFVAEYGMLKTLKGSMKGIIEYAQKHGAQRATNASEAARAGISSIQKQVSSSGGNKFFEGMELI